MCIINSHDCDFKYVLRTGGLYFRGMATWNSHSLFRLECNFSRLIWHMRMERKSIAIKQMRWKKIIIMQCSSENLVRRFCSRHWNFSIAHNKRLTRFYRWLYKWKQRELYSMLSNKRIRNNATTTTHRYEFVTHTRSIDRYNFMGKILHFINFILVWLVYFVPILP